MREVLSFTFCQNTNKVAVLFELFWRENQDTTVSYCSLLLLFTPPHDHDQLERQVGFQINAL